MKFPYFEQLQQEVKDGWVEVVTHPILPLSIYNYSRKTQFDNNWNEVRKQCRGLVLDNTGEIIAMCFPKFFNYEEIRYKEEIPINEIPIIQNKEDGSLGIIFYYNNIWHVATRGSFLSEQAVKGQEILNKQIHLLTQLNENYTYLVEIIYPENRIVIDYKGEEKLIWLSVFDNSTGKELTLKECNDHWADILVQERVNSYYEKEGVFGESMFNKLKSSYKENTEGFVIKFEPSGYRLKIKFEEYCRLHKLLTNVNAVDIWECLKNNDDLNKIIEQVPDEFDSWIKGIIEDLELQHSRIYNWCLEYRDNMRVALGYESSRKDYAVWIQTNVKPRYQGIVFYMLDDRNYKSISESIWKLIKPTNKKAFWNDKKLA